MTRVTINARHPRTVRSPHDPSKLAWHMRSMDVLYTEKKLILCRALEGFVHTTSMYLIRGSRHETC